MVLLQVKNCLASWRQWADFWANARRSKVIDRRIHDGQLRSVLRLNCACECPQIKAYAATIQMCRSKSGIRRALAPPGRVGTAAMMAAA
jgi:hypothetical protein